MWHSSQNSIGQLWLATRSIAGPTSQPLHHNGRHGNHNNATRKHDQDVVSCRSSSFWAIQVKRILERAGFSGETVNAA